MKTTAKTTYHLTQILSESGIHLIEIVQDPRCRASLFIPKSKVVSEFFSVFFQT